MIDALSNAAAALFNDPNLSAPATYTPAGAGGLPIGVRVILGDPNRNIPGIGALSAGAPAATADMLAAVVPETPKRGALLETARGRFKVSDAKLDPRGLRWRLVLTNA